MSVRPAPIGPDRARIAAQNDALRRQIPFSSAAGSVVMTAGVAALPPAQLLAVLRAVAQFRAFTPDNDPYLEHDCAVVKVDGESYIWKIDYYADASMSAGAEDPAETCHRLLTIMLASEY